MKKQFAKYILGLFASVLFFACAQVVAPSGGERDVTPPEILKSNPENQSTNFQSKTIELTFDEFVKLNNLKEELIVSPPLKYNLQTKISGKTLRIEIKDTLMENTTYVFNFGDAIVDIRENNPISNYQYVFSTGNSLDSLKIQGIIVDAFSLTPAKEMLVMLYSDVKNDSAPLLNLPTYVGKSDPQGIFTVSNIKEGSYKLFALKDANNNYLFDQPDEMIAFKKVPLKIQKNLQKLKLYSFKEEEKEQYIENQTETGSQLILQFKKNTKEFDYKLIDTTESLLLKSYLNEKGDSAFFWWNQGIAKNVKMAVFDHPVFADTIRFSIDSIKGKLKLDRPISATQNFFSPISLNFNRPISKLNKEKIKVNKTDSSSVEFEIKKGSGENQQNFLLNFPIEEDNSYNLSILPGAFIDIYNETNDTIKCVLSFNKPSDFGSLEVKLKTKYSDQKLIQLLDENGKVLQQKIIERSDKTKTNSVKFNYLTNGIYGLKFIMDWHRNGKWDTGNYLKKSLPEKTIIFDEKINIRSNWDKEIEWIIK